MIVHQGAIGSWFIKDIVTNLLNAKNVYCQDTLYFLTVFIRCLYTKVRLAIG